MPRIRIDLSYDGESFCGWQLQKRDPSVQGAIENALLDLTGQEVRVIGSGRTDSGVHALRQTAHFDCDSSIPAEKYTPALNSKLPPGVRILRSIAVTDEFHARYSARKRVYRYLLKPERPGTPFDRGRVWCLGRRPDLVRLNSLAVPLVGTHDFTTFTAAGDASDSKVRSIESAAFFPDRGRIVFQISGNAFLWRMVRSIVGTLLDLEAQGCSAQTMREILSAADRSCAGPTAPPEGLYLYKVLYDEQCCN